MTVQKTRQTLIKAGFILQKAHPPKVYGMGIGKIASIFHFTLEDTPIVELADRMEQEQEVQAVGVINRNGKAVGIITRKDLFGMLSRPYGRDVLRKKSIGSIALKTDFFNYNDNIFTVSDEIEEKVNSNDQYYFLLTDDNGGYCGIFSGKDMLVFLADITKQDIALSRKIQTRIVKEEDEYSGKGYSITASSVMAKGIGGDFYSVKKISDSLHLLILCDVSGKGMAASLLSSLLSGFFNTYPISTDLPGMIYDLNQQLTKSFEGEKFVTGVFCLYNSDTGSIEIADMGHTHYLHISESRLRKLSNSAVNIPMGVSSELEVQTYKITLRNSDCFMIMTDGILEQKNAEGEVFDYDRIKHSLSDHRKVSAKGLRARLLADFDRFRGNSARQDDVTFLLLKHSPEISSKTDLAASSSLSGNRIEDKIKWSIETGKPIQIRSSRYLPEDRDFIDTVLDRYLNEAGIKFLMNKISYCVHELATNAKKANTKRVFFKLKGLDINNIKHYQLGMKDFKNETIREIDYFLDQQKKQGFFIVIMLHLTKSHLKISVTNNAEMTSEEKLRVKHKLEIAGKSSSITEIYDKIEDYSEGAGLGIVMMSQMLRSMGLGPDVLSISSENGLTVSSINIELRTH